MGVQKPWGEHGARKRSVALSPVRWPCVVPCDDFRPRVCVCLQEIGDLLAPPSSVDDVAAAAVAHVLDAPKTTA